MSQQSDHDLLIQIDANLKNFLTKFAEHAEDDKNNFHKHDARLSTIEKSWWKACGALSVIVVFVDILVKIVLQ